MDPSSYKTIQTSRGLTYNYYFAAAKQSQPTILFCHGFPSLSTHWAGIAAFFEQHDFGVVVPDMIGYGDTSKPTETEAYVPSKVSRDLVDILDAENIEKAIAVGHDWGSSAVSRLANHFPERFLAYAFFNVPYVRVTPPIPYETLLAAAKAKHGVELFGYWEYCAKGDLDGDFRAYPESLVNILFSKDPTVWLTHIAPPGALQKALQSRTLPERAEYLSDREAEEFIKTFRKNGFHAPTRWYDVKITNMAAEDDLSTIPEDHRFPPESAPLFYGGGTYDAVCRAQDGYELFRSKLFEKHNVTIREFEADHWTILSCVTEVNKELLQWIEEVVLKKAKL